MTEQNKFIDYINSLNDMELKDKGLYQQYSMMKAAAKVLDERVDEINQLIVEEMERLGVERQTFEYGVFSLTSRKKWKYSPDILSKEREVKELKKREEDEGKATFEETKSLLFR